MRNGWWWGDSERDLGPICAVLVCDPGKYLAVIGAFGDWNSARVNEIDRLQKVNGHTGH